jgi:hypothetical protein
MHIFTLLAIARTGRTLSQDDGISHSDNYMHAVLCTSARTTRRQSPSAYGPQAVDTMLMSISGTSVETKALKCDLYDLCIVRPRILHICIYIASHAKITAKHKRDSRNSPPRAGAYLNS